MQDFFMAGPFKVWPSVCFSKQPWLHAAAFGNGVKFDHGLFDVGKVAATANTRAEDVALKMWTFFAHRHGRFRTKPGRPVADKMQRNVMHTVS